MMNRISVATALGVAVSLVATASAGMFKDGNAIYSVCTAPMGDDRFSTCLGYIDAIVDAMDGNAIDGFVACVPRGVENSQIRDVVNQYLWANAAKRHLVAAGLIAQALAHAFPCR